RLENSKRTEPKISVPDGVWQIPLLENTEDDTQAGDIVIHSELALPSKADLGAGSMTKRIATRRMGGNESAATQRYEPAAAAPSGAIPGIATIEYEDNGGKKKFVI